MTREVISWEVFHKIQQLTELSSKHCKTREGMIQQSQFNKKRSQVIVALKLIMVSLICYLHCLCVCLQKGLFL